MPYEWNFAIALTYLPQLLAGAVNTAKLVGSSLLLATPIGVVLGIVRHQRVPLLGALAVAYIDFFRSSVALVLEYRWTGFMAMTPDRYPRLLELAPGVAAALGYSGRGLAMATIMGAELSRWAFGECAIDDLALPRSALDPLPYYGLKEIIVEGAILYYGARDRLKSWAAR